jgi:hypothetical protein
MSFYRYRAYGLTFSMPFPCPELLPAPELSADLPPDVVVRFGDTPEYLVSPMEEGVWYQAEPNRFLCRPRGVADFLVENGTCITIKPQPGTPENDIRSFLLGTCISALLPQRGMLCLHASAVQARQGAVLFAGDPGAGKSSTLAEFLRRGYAMLSDDMCGVVQQAGPENMQNGARAGRVYVVPAFPQIKMWRTAAERLGLAYDERRRVAVHEDKYGISVQQFAGEAVPFVALYWLGRHAGDELKITPLSGMEKFGAFTHNASGWRSLDRMRVFSPSFEIAAAAANQVRVCRILRSAQRDTLAELVDLVLHDLETHCAA